MFTYWIVFFPNVPKDSNLDFSRLYIFTTAMPSDDVFHPVLYTIALFIYTVHFA